jgi:DNA-directed RNA polymerase specialized sigma24 family protein
LDEIPDISRRRDPELIAIDDALNTLAGLDPRKARVIELRFFGGLSVEETAEVFEGPRTNRAARLAVGAGLADARAWRALGSVPNSSDRPGGLSYNVP